MTKQEQYDRIVAERVEAKRLMFLAHDRGDEYSVEFYYRLTTNLFIEAMLLQPHPDLDKVAACVKSSIQLMKDPSSFVDDLNNKYGLSI